MGFFDTLKKAANRGKHGLNPAVPNAAPVTDSIELDTDRRSVAITTSITESAERSIKSHILFVATGADWHQGIQRELLVQQPGWECHIARDIAQAVKVLREGHFQAVIMHATVAADAAFTALLQLEGGKPLRIVLCDFSDRKALARFSITGDTPLALNTDAAVLAATILRLARVQEWMSDTGMKNLLARCRKLPVMPRLYSEVTVELGSPDGSLEVVARAIAQDPVMAAKILQLVNSAFFGLNRQVTEPYEAVLFLGTERTRSLLLLAGVFTQFESLDCPGFSGEQVWNHSLHVGTMARTITIAEVKNVKLAEAAFTAGLIHDMGKLILMANVPAMCTAIQQLGRTKQITQREAELQVLGTTHAELAACLLGNWGLTLPVLEAVAWHHCPMRSSDREFTLLTAVHAANVFAHESGADAGSTAMPERFDLQYLLRIERGDRRNDWRKACGVPLKPEEDHQHAHVRQRREAKVN